MQKIDGFTYKKLRGRLSLLSGVTAAVITIVLFVVYTSGYIGHDFYKNLIIYTLALLVFFCSFIGMYWQRRYDYCDKYWPVFAIILGISNGFAVGLIARTSFFIIGEFSGYFVSIFALLFGVVATYASLSMIHRLSQNRFLLYVTGIFAIGVSAATVNTNIFDWWSSSICALGMPSHANSDIYNSTLVILGMLMVLFLVYMIPQFKQLFHKKIVSRPKIIVITTLYIFEIIGIMLVGLLPFGINHFVATAHVFFGGFVFYNLGIIMLLAIWLFNKFPAKFMKINYLLLAAGVICYYASFILCFVIKVKWLAFPLAEFVTAVIIIIWLLILLDYIRQFARIHLKEL